LLKLASEYSLGQWRNDPDVDLETKRFIRSLTNKAPYCADTIAAIQSQFDLADVSFSGQKSEGLRFAVITNSIAISLASSPEWDKSILSIDLEAIDPDGEIVCSAIDIKHASSQQHIEEITPWIKDRLSIDIRDGRQLWLERNNLFDCLDFCDRVEKQLTDILSGDPKLIRIINVLSILNQRCQVWNDGSLYLKGYLEESRESESTMNNQSFREKRTFLCPDGEKRVFEPHIKLREYNWRIHFLAETPGRATIGYIGIHLPTTKYRH
jgi:hypothetical protein